MAAVVTVGELFKRLEQLNAVGAALSQERDINALLEKILRAAKDITNADAVTSALASPRWGPRRRDTIARARKGNGH